MAPVGVFASGVGGLPVARALLAPLPAAALVSVGAPGPGPSGPLPLPALRAPALALGAALVGRGVPALVLACPSASSACLRAARARSPVPVVAVL
ncbi:glutamate racemase, partial [Mycobacterium tuberculosis]